MRKQINEVTEEDYQLFLKHKRLTSYTQADIAEINHLVNTYINEHHSNCSSCGSGGLRVAKDLCAIYLANGEQTILAAIEERKKKLETPVVNTTDVTIEESKSQVEDFKKTNRRKK